MYIPTLEIGEICPNCGSAQFSTSHLPPANISTDLPPGVLGVADCQTCQQEFFIRLSPNLKNAFAKIFEGRTMKEEILKILFP